MKNIFKIFKKDINGIITNWVVLIVIIGLMILPSLYAWFNIRACWDPYGSTGGIKIAIVNNDEGGKLQDKEINIGDQIIEKLKSNTALGWQFVSEEEGNTGVEEGRYYATIIIPKEFTSETLSVMDNIIKRPTLIYKVNQKSNAITPKITDKGVSSIKSEVDSNIIETVDGIIFNLFNELGISIEGSKNKILKLVDGVIELNNKLPEIETIISDLYNGTSSVESLISKTKDSLPVLEDTLNNSNSLLSDTKDALEKTKEALADISPVIKSDLEFINKELNNLSILIDSISNINMDKDSIVNGLNNISSKIAGINDKITGIINKLEPLAKFDENIKTTVDNLNLASSKIYSVINIVNGISNLVSNSSPIDKSKLQDIKTLIDENNSIISNILDNYDSVYVPAINNAIDKLNTIADNSIKLLDYAKSAIPDINNLLDNLNNVVKLSKDDIEKLNEEMPTIKTSLNNISYKLSQINNEETIDKLLDLLENDWKAVSEFLGSPVNIKEEVLFPIPNYGSAMSPFYSTLSIWVGALILVSILTTEPKGFEDNVILKPHEKYIGKLLTFITIGFFQVIILTLGDIYLLKCYVLNKGLFIGVGLLSSVVFITIVYTLVSIFDNIGKAIAIVLLVIQVAGAGGTFPVEVMPTFFKRVNPFLPFTYAISAMREAVGGVVKSLLIKDIIIILVYGVIFLLIGLFLKGPVNKVSKKLVEKFNESNLVGH